MPRALLIALVLAPLLGGQAFAHARLVSSDPAAGARLGAPPGRYLVRWRALSPDAHRTRGEFAFTIGR